MLRATRSGRDVGWAHVPILFVFCDLDPRHEDGRARVPILRLPFAGELQGALADWLGERLVRREGVEPFAWSWVLGT